MHKKTKTLLATGVAAILMATSAPALVAAQALILPFAQATLAEAQSLLQEALNRLERAKAEGDDVGAAEAEVEAAKAAVEAMQQAEAQAAAEAEAAKAAEAEAAAKAAAEEEARKTAEAEEAAKAAEAQAAAEAEAAKAAEADAAAKAAAEEEARKAAEAEEAAKAAEAQAAADAEAAKAAEAEAAAKAAADEEARKAAEAEAAAKAAEAQAAADAEAANAAAAEAAAKAAAEEEARKAAEAAEQNAEPKPVPAEPAPAEPATEAPQPAPVDPAPVEPQPEQPAPAQPAPEQPAVPAEPAPAPEVPAAPQPEPPVPAPADPAPAEPQPEQPAPVVPAPAPAEPAPMPVPDPVLEKLPEPLPENAAPALDSAKEELPPLPPADLAIQPLQPVAPPVPAPDPATPPAPAPIDDNQARIDIAPVQVNSAIVENGERLTEMPTLDLPPQETVLEVIDNRTIINIGTQIIINTPDSSRLVEEDDEVIIEQLPRGRTRETIVRDNGVQVVTIRNRYGDVIQRSRILPDGREVILAYTPEYDTEEDYVWRDPAYDLPPLQLNVPIREYILSVSLIEDDPQDYDEEEIYYEFLDKPPVERVERIYSVDDVKRSARVRDKVRRIDLDTLTFGFGSAEIKEDQIEKLEKVANAMLKLLEKNPGETFLIEGHTDAVGTDKANLILSDKRAEAIAEALTGAFGVPAENMTTQGYGERYLKVKSQKPEELNRRVAIRRITSLVAPVALK